MARKKPSQADIRFGQRLARLRKAATLTQQDVATAFKLSVQAVSGWERGAALPGIHRLPQLAALYNQTLEGLIGFVSKGRAKRIGVPVVSYVQAGEWKSTRDGIQFDSERFVSCDTPVSEFAFALQIEGKSMEKRFLEGDVIIVEPRNMLDPQIGDFVVAKESADQKATFKQYWRHRGSVVELRPLNEEHPLLTIDETTPGEIIGTMIEHHSYRRRLG